MAPSTIEAPVRITGQRRPGVYLGALPNGKEITAFIPPKLSAAFPQQLEPGVMVIARLTTHDFSMGMILRLQGDAE